MSLVIMFYFTSSILNIHHQEPATFLLNHHIGRVYPCGRLKPVTRTPPQPSHTETPTHVETRKHDQCGDSIEKSQAPDYVLMSETC